MSDFHASVEAALREHDIMLPEPPAPVAAYVPAVRTGHQIVVSGQLPFTAGQLLAEGKVDSVVDEDHAATAARQCAINGLAVLFGEIGRDWNRLVRVVRIGCFVNADADFTGHSIVANGASDLLVALLGERGKHARAAVGCSSLPLGAAVEVEFVFEVTD